MRIDDIPIIVEETTFIEREGIKYTVEDRFGNTAYFKHLLSAKKYAKDVNGELKEV